MELQDREVNLVLMLEEVIKVIKGTKGIKDYKVNQVGKGIQAPPVRMESKAPKARKVCLALRETLAIKDQKKMQVPGVLRVIQDPQGLREPPDPQDPKGQLVNQGRMEPKGAKEIKVKKATKGIKVKKVIQEVLIKLQNDNSL